MEALELLRGFLKANGFDGLYLAGECACTLEALCTCENLENVTDGECRPGVHRPVPEGSDWQFCIGSREEIDERRTRVPIQNLHDAIRYEAELARAAALLQKVLPVGQVKHIGLLEVSAGLAELLNEWAITGQPGSREEAAIRDILGALAQARAKHPQWQADVIHSAAVLAEEAGEVVKAALDLTYFNAPNHQHLMAELAQVGAMAIRMLVNLPLCEIHPDLVNEVPA